MADNLFVQPYDIVGSDIDDKYVIRIWSHDRDSNRVLVRVEDFHPFIRIELPTLVDGRFISWDRNSLEVYGGWLRSRISGIKQIKYIPMKRLYLFRNNSKFPMITCYFETEAALRSCNNMLNNRFHIIPQLGNIRVKIWETKIESVHRMVTEINIGYCQWLKINADPVVDDDRMTNPPTLEYIASYQSIIGLPETDTSNWLIDPIVAAVDIECYSSNHKAIPNKLYIQDCIFMISYVVQRLNGNNQARHLIVYGDCPDIEGAIVHRFDHEIRAVEFLAELIKKTDPTLLVGYNTFKFDYPYLDARLKLYLRGWQNISLLRTGSTFLSTKSWKSSAYGHVEISLLEAEGLINIDMYPIIKRSHNLDRYTLDFVSRHFLGRGKHDVSPQDMFRAYQSFLELSKKKVESPDDPTVIASYQQIMEEFKRIGEYNLEDSVLCIDLMKTLQTWIDLSETANVVAVSLTNTFTRGQQLRVQNQVYQYAYRENFVIDERPGGNRFMGAHVVDPIPGRAMNILILDFASLYPSIIQAFNICHTTLVPDESNIPDEQCHVLKWEEPDGDQQVKHRYRFIKQEYYHGILPRMCRNLITARKTVRKMIGPQNSEVTNIVLNQRQNALKVSANSIFGALGVKEGRIPLPEGAASITAMGRILSGKAAEYVRDKYQGRIIYGDTDSIMIDLNIGDPHDCHTMGERIGKEISDLFPPPLRIEHERTLSTAVFIKKKYYVGVPMLTIENKDEIQVTEITEVEFSPEYQNENLRLWRIRYTETRYGKSNNKTVYIGVPPGIKLSLGQAHYSGIPLIEQQTSQGTRYGAPDQKKILKKGIVLARRDNCLWLRQAYTKVILNVLFNKPLSETLEIIDQEILRMMSRSVPFLEMSVTREIRRDNYKLDSYPLKIFSDELRRAGYPVQTGDRIDYVFVVNSQPDLNTKQGYKMRIHEHFWRNYQVEPLDRLHYIEKALMKPVEQILYLGYKDQIDQIQAKCRPSIVKRNILYTYISSTYIKTWIKLIQAKKIVTDSISQNKFHFIHQDPYFSLNV